MDCRGAGLGWRGACSVVPRGLAPGQSSVLLKAASWWLQQVLRGRQRGPRVISCPGRVPASRREAGGPYVPLSGPPGAGFRDSRRWPRDGRRRNAASPGGTGPWATRDRGAGP